MITFVPEEIEKYAVAHTTALPGHMAKVMEETYATQKDAGMLSGPMEGMLLQFLVWASGAKRILEVGTFTGFSAQMMAAALPPDGRLVTCELDPGTAKVAQANFDKGPHKGKIELRLGPALETIK
ncbi:MAG: methyltransferase, partial [SAR202 cluster bacterium]|nr:methyltransferase [SAR202 cluster bacterium]